MNKSSRPKFGIGTWPLGGDYWGDQNHSDSLKMIHCAIRNGFTLFDTAPVYGKGRSEQLLGQQLKKIRNSVTISSKCFLKPLDEFKKSFENSLKRLNTRYIDNFFIHWPSTTVDSRPIMEFLEKERKKERIINIGVSNFNKNQLKVAMEAGRVDIVQNAYNLLYTKDEAYFNHCRELSITTQGYSLLAQGLLTGKFSSSNPYPKDGFRHKMTLFNKENLNTVFKTVKKLESVAENEGLSLYQLVLKWSSEQKSLDTLIIGCRNRKQVEDLANIKNLTISKNAIDIMDKISNEASKELHLGNNIFNHFY